jgi:hypothetical protein
MIVERATGPTFSDELIKAGVADGVMWTPTTISIVDGLPDETVNAIMSVIEAHDPAKPVPTVAIVSVIEIYRRMTDDEFNRMAESVATQTPRIRGIFERAVTFRSDAPEWALLQHMAVGLYGPDRAAELLSPDTGGDGT